MNNKELQETARKIRYGIIESIHAAGSGHPGGSLSAADIITELYFEEMNIDPKDPKMKGRDKLILSKGHAAPAQYAALAERGYFPREELLTLRKLGSRLENEKRQKNGGVIIACGMALANRLDQDPGRIYVILGDGELQEGIVWEAAMSAAHYHLDQLVAIVDHNGLQIDGSNDDVMKVNPIADKFAAFGWNTLSIDGHDFDQIRSALAEARACEGRPTVIVAETVKGKGVSFMENEAGWHGKATNDEQTEQALKELGGGR